jgi:hypothetical protein
MRSGEILGEAREPAMMTSPTYPLVACERCNRVGLVKPEGWKTTPLLLALMRPALVQDGQTGHCDRDWSRPTAGCA